MSKKKQQHHRNKRSGSPQALHSLSPQKSVTWCLVELPLPEAIDPAGLVHILALLSLDDGYMHLAHPVIFPGSAEEIAGGVVQRLRQLPKHKLPGRLLFFEPHLLEGLRAPLAEFECQLGLGEMPEGFVQALHDSLLASGMPAVSFGRFMGVRSGHARLAAVAARIAAQAPWEHLSEGEAFDLRSKQTLGWPLVSFIGEMGEQRGVVFYPSFEAFIRIHTTQDPSLLTTLNMISMLFFDPDEFGPLFCKAYARRGLALHEGDYPVLQWPRALRGQQKVALDIEDDAIIEEILTSLEALASVVEAAARAGFPDHTAWRSKGEEGSASRQIIPHLIQDPSSDVSSAQSTDANDHMRLFRVELNLYFDEMDHEYSVIFAGVSSNLLAPEEQTQVGRKVEVPTIILCTVKSAALAQKTKLEAIEALVLMDQSVNKDRSILVQREGKIAGILCDFSQGFEERVDKFRRSVETRGGYAALAFAKGGADRRTLNARDIVLIRLVRVETSLSQALLQRTVGVDLPPTQASSSWHHNVAQRLIQGVQALSLEPDARVQALRLWEDVARELSLESGAEEQYAAAVCYCLVKLSGLSINQSDIAQVFGTSTASVSKRYRSIWSALDLDHQGQRYQGAIEAQRVPSSTPQQGQRSPQTTLQAEYRYLELEVTLWQSRPRIWRRIQLSESASFADLHAAIQSSFGWYDSHLWEFRESGRRGGAICGISDPDLSDPWGEPVMDAKKMRLQTWFKAPGSHCDYIYDFGDDWVHRVELRQVVTSNERFQRRLIDGRLAGPPEDCGGLPGYARFSEVILTGKDPWNEDVAELREWLGDWHPHHFDLKKAQKRFNR